MARKSLTFDPFRSPALPDANLSEVGNSSLNIRHIGRNQYLVTSLYRDCVVMLMQDRDIRLFKHQEGKVQLGRGPSEAKMVQRSRKQQMNLAESYAESLENALSTEMEVNFSLIYLVPAVHNCFLLTFSSSIFQAAAMREDHNFAPQNKARFKPPAKKSDNFPVQGKGSKHLRLSDISKRDTAKAVRDAEEVHYFFRPYSRYGAAPFRMSSRKTVHVCHLAGAGEKS